MKRSKPDIETEARLRWYMKGGTAMRLAVEIWEHSDAFCESNGLVWLRRFAPEQLRKRDEI